MREIRLYGSEGGGAVRSPYPYPGWSGRVGPLSPCAGFLLERSDLEFFHSSPCVSGTVSSPVDRFTHSPGLAPADSLFDLDSPAPLLARMTAT